MGKKARYNHSLLKWSYVVLKEVCHHIDLGHYDTYGIQLSGPNYMEVLHDVSTKEDTAFWIAGLLNKHQVFPCHFKDIVENLIQ